jgi:hypothetical protein
VGVYIGAYGVKVVTESLIRLTTGVIIIICVLSRIIALPVYFRALGWMHFDAGMDRWLNTTSTVVLFTAGIGGALMILYKVAMAHLERQRIHTTLLVTKGESES